jgi:hypothetical protein
MRGCAGSDLVGIHRNEAQQNMQADVGVQVRKAHLLN